MKFILNLIIVLSFLFTQCKVDAPIPIYGKFGEDFTLKYRQCIILSDSLEADNNIEDDETVKVCFKQFIKENRCPKCVWQGEAIIEILFKLNEEKKLSLKLSTYYNHFTPIDTLGYKIRILGLKPEPKRWGQKFRRSKYKAFLNVSK